MAKKQVSKTRAQQPLSIEDLPEKVRKAFEPLTQHERRFVEFFCGEARGSNTAAVVMAGICSEKSTYPARASKASRLNKDPRIKEAKEAWMEAFALSPTQIKHKLADLADASPWPFFEVEEDTPTQAVVGTITGPGTTAPATPPKKSRKGRLKIKPISQEDWDRYAPWVKSVEMNEDGYVIGLQLHDRLHALEKLAKINGLYSDAPIFTFNLFARNTSDEEIIRQIMEARAEEQNQLPGAPIAVIPPPKE